jgi:hypothetical protein
MSNQLETQEFSSPGELATAFGTSIYMPSSWPRYVVGRPRYLLDVTPKFEESFYRIDLATDDGVPLLVAGKRTPPSQRAGQLGAPESHWFAVPELSSSNGLALRQDNQHFHIVIGIPMQVHLSGYRTLTEGIEAARQLTEHRAGK